MVQTYAKSIDKEASRAFKKVKADIEELRRLLNTKQDKQSDILINLNNLRSEMRIEFKEDLLEMQKSIQNEINTLRKEVLYYRELCEQHRIDHHKVKIVERRERVISEARPAEAPTSSISETRREYNEVMSTPTRTEYKPIPEPKSIEDLDRENKKSYLKWISVGDDDLDLIDEVEVK